MSTLLFSSIRICTKVRFFGVLQRSLETVFRWWETFTLLCGEFSQDTNQIVSELSKFCIRYNKYIVAYFLLGHGVCRLLACCKVSGVNIVCAQLQYLELKLYFVSMRCTVASVLDWPLRIRLATLMLLHLLFRNETDNQFLDK